MANKFNIIFTFLSIYYISYIYSMSLQIFKKEIPDEIVLQFLDDVCTKTAKHYTLNTIIFKQGVYNGTIQNFINTCIPYYHISKRKYLERKLTYNSFTTILRQICKFNKFTYTSQIHYDKSCYDIIYYIFYKT